MKEYKVEMFQFGKWVDAKGELGRKKTYTSLDEALDGAKVIASVWKIKNPVKGKPTHYRIVSREVSDWSGEIGYLKISSDSPTLWI